MMARRILALVVLAGAALFAARLLASRESAQAPVEIPASPSVVAAADPVLAGVDAIGRRELPAVVDEASAGFEPSAQLIPNPTGDPGLRLWGTVRVEGLVLAPVEVECTNGLGIQRGLRVDARSRYSFDGLPPGVYWVRAGRDETGIGHARVDLRADTRIDFALERPRMLDVRVLDQNGVAWVPPGIVAIATASPPGARLEQGAGAPMFAARGRNLDSFEDGSTFPPLLLEARTPMHVSLVHYEAVVATRLVGPDDTEVVFRIARDELSATRGSVVFRLIDATTRAPLANPTVPIDGQGMLHVPCTDGVGRAPLAPGSWTLRVSMPELGYVQVPFRIEPGVELDLGDIAIGGGATIRGRVVDEQGRGRLSALECDPCDEHGVVARKSSTLYLLETASDGSFQLRGLPRGRHRLSISGARRTLGGAGFELDEVRCVRVVEVGTNDVEGLVLKARTAIPLVVRPSGREVSGAGVRVLSPEGLVVETRTLAAHAPVRIDLAPGSYDVETWTERDGAHERTPIEVVREPVVVDVH